MATKGIRLSDFMADSESISNDKVREDVGLQEPKADVPMRLGDYMSLNRVPLEPEETDNFNEEDLSFTIEDSRKEEFKKKGSIGFFEAATRNISDAIPFSTANATKSLELLDAVNRLKRKETKGESRLGNFLEESTKAGGIIRGVAAALQTPLSGEERRQKDIELVSKFLEEIEEERVRGFTIPGRIGQGVVNLPAFMVEFIATGGLATLGKNFAKKSLEKLAQRQLEKGVGKFVSKTTQTASGAVLRTAAMPQRVIASGAERQVDANLELTEKGMEIAKEAKEKPLTSALKGFGDVFIENFSEETGVAISAGLTKFKTALPGGLIKTLEKTFKKLNPNKKVAELWTKAGYNGFIEEMGEERIGNLLRAVTGVEDFGADNPDSILDRVVNSIPNGEELLVEAGIIAFPGGARASVSTTVDFIKKHKASLKSAQPVEVKELPDEQIDIVLSKEEKIALQEEGEAETVPVPTGRRQQQEEGAKQVQEQQTQEEVEEETELEPVEGDVSFEFGENIKEEIVQETKGVSKLQERLAKIEDQKERRELTKDARRQLEEIRDVFKGQISIEKSDISKEAAKRIPAIFKRRGELGLDEVRENANEAGIGLNFETQDELIDFMESLEKRKSELDDFIASTREKTIKKRESTLLKERIKDRKAGIREGRALGREEVKSAKQILERRRFRVKAIRDAIGLTDSELKQITKRDIRLMSNFEFKKFLDDIEAKAIELAEKRDIKNEILFQIQDKELKKVDNLIKFMKLPTLNKMSVKQLNELNQALEEFQRGDEFLSLRKLETVANTELGGIKTVREAKEKLAKKLDVPLSEVSNIDVGALDKFRFDTALAKRNPFYQLLVDETNASILDGEQRFLDMEREVDELTNKARKSRKQGIKDRLAPTDALVFDWLEAKTEAEFDKTKDKGKTKEQLAEKMTDEELALAGYLQKRFAEFRDYLIQHKTLERYQSNYITHIRRGFLETWKEDGLVNAFKEVFAQYQEDEVNFKILEDDTENILPLEKFFQFSMKRSGELKPSKNVSRAFKAYTKAFTKKQSLDKIVPALDIYAYSLSPKAVTPRGLQMDRRLIKFVREWVNNKKGRKTSLGGILPQGGVIDVGLRTIDGFITLIDLGLNIPVGLTVQVGEQITTFTNLGSKKYSKGILRMNTKRGKEIINKNEAFVGKSIWRELSDTADGIGNKFHKGLFSLFSIANITANKIHLLGSLSKEEWESGEISSQRKSELKREIGRFRNVEGAKSIFGSSSAGSVLSKYKTWAIPIINTVVDDIATVSQMVARGNFKETIKSREFAELMRGITTTALIVVAGRGMIDDEDDSFLGETLRKAYRESMTLLGAIDPRLFLTEPRLVSFLSDLAVAFVQILTLEEYKRKPGFKGVEKLKQTVIPRSIQKVLKSGKKSNKGASAF